MKRDAPMKRTPFPPRRQGLPRRNCGLPRAEFKRTEKAPARSVKPLPRVSPKRKVQEAEYRKLRKPFLAERPVCEFPLGCDRPAVEVQHTRGRFGWRLCYVPWWKASCHEHNMRAEEQTREALNCGWLVLIEGVDAVPADVDEVA